MKSILFLAYYYPPVNNAATQRIEKFAKFLPQFSFKPIILTTSYFSREYSLIRNFHLARKDLKNKRGAGLVYRASELRNLVVKSGEEHPRDISGYSENKKKSFKNRLKRFLKTWILIPDSKVSWLPFAFLKALKIIRKHRVEYIVSSFPPATSHLLGLLLQKCTYVKWIADFRDGWCFDPLDPILYSPTRLTLEKIFERKVVKNCDKILVTSPGVGNYFRKSGKVSLITNGFDSDDFVLAQKTLDRFQNLEKYFIISHTGAFHLSHQGNTPYYFLKGLKETFREHPEMKSKTRVFFLGNLTSREKKMAKEMGLGNAVKVLGLCSHKEAICYRLISQVLLLVDRPTKERSTYIHGKVFEHLASRKPILALLPKMSAARDFLNKIGVGDIVEPHDIEGIKQKLWELFYEWQKGGILRYELTNEELSKFERENLTKRLVDALNELG